MSARVLLPVVLLVAAASAGVGVLARELYQRPTQAQGDQVVAPRSSVSVPRGDQPGAGDVQLSVDAALHPDGERVRAVLQEYFDAINARDYDRWTKSVTGKRASQTLRASWETEYSTSRDGSIVVHRVEAVSSTRLRVMMTFTSTQDVSLAPPELPADCIRWRVVYPLQVDGGALRVDFGTEGSSSQFSPC